MRQTELHLSEEDRLAVEEIRGKGVHHSREVNRAHVLSCLAVCPAPALRPVLPATSVLRDGQMSDKPKQKATIASDRLRAVLTANRTKPSDPAGPSHVTPVAAAGDRAACRG